jgi:hypothetical protein
LFFLVLLIVCAQAIELFALARLANAAPAGTRSTVSADLTELVGGAVLLIATCIGPFLVFALAGLFVFRHFYWALWCLVLCASAYAALMILGLLTEYGMARAAADAAQRGGRYMNCGGHPRLFMILFTLPLTAGTLIASTAVLSLEASIRSVLNVQTIDDF